MSVLAQVGERDVFAELSRFRTAFYGALSARADAFFELTDALLCADGPVRTPVELSLIAEHQRGYGSLYGALNRGRPNTDALRDLLVSQPLPRFGGRIVLTVAAIGRRLLAGAAVLPRPRPVPRGRADHPWLAVLLRRRADAGPHLVPIRGRSRPWNHEVQGLLLWDATRRNALRFPEHNDSRP
ncbi:transposase [Streptomyces sp. RB6PN25]|uniref:Transposase n=1 Tax=Streptomyces humicola TaxID=2953240 RepID=A0ABT1PPV4_9ACTN|nr:transposase [Streptomyces humicola]